MPDSAAKSIRYLKVRVSMPVSQPSSVFTFPNHQSQTLLPGLTQEKSPSGGGFRLMIMLDSMSRPTSGWTMITRHGERCGRPCSTGGPPTEESSTRSVKPPACFR